MCVCIYTFLVIYDTGWRKLIGSTKLHIIFHKRATKYRSLLRKMTYKDKGSYESSPPLYYVHINDSWDTRIRTGLLLYIRLCIFMYICLYRKHVYIYLYAYTYVYTHIHICIHTYIAATSSHVSSYVWIISLEWILHVMSPYWIMPFNIYKSRHTCGCVMSRERVMSHISMRHVCLHPRVVLSRYVAVSCSVLQCVAECGSMLQRVSVCCSVLQRVAVYCSVMQCVAVCCRRVIVMYHAYESRYTHVNESCHTHEADMPRRQMRHAAHINESRYTYK